MIDAEFNSDELLSLLDGVFSDACDGADLNRLEALLIESAAARQLYLQYVDLQASLAGPPAALAIASNQPPDRSEPHQKTGAVSRPSSSGSFSNSFGSVGDSLRRPPSISVILAVATVAAVLMVLALIPFHTAQVREAQSDERAGSDHVDDPPAVGRSIAAAIGRTVNCRWKNPTGLASGSAVFEGETVAVESGEVEIVFRSGATIVIRGPAAVRVDSAAVGFGESGALGVTIPRKVAAFTIECDTMRIDYAVDRHARRTSRQETNFFARVDGIHAAPASTSWHGHLAAIGRSDAPAAVAFDAVAPDGDGISIDRDGATEDRTDVNNDDSAEFGVHVQPGGVSELHVFRGEVSVASTALWTGAPFSRRFSASQAVALDALAKAVVEKPAELVRFSSLLALAATDAEDDGESTRGATKRAGTIASVRASTGRQYRVVPGGMRHGAEMFIDRDYRWEQPKDGEFPAELIGADYVKTANDDKGDWTLEVTLELRGPATVYVLILDESDMPKWLTEKFVDTGMDVLAHVDPNAKNARFRRCSVWKRETTDKSILLGAASRGPNRVNLVYGVAAVLKTEEKQEDATETKQQK
jgi:hypothetical protein